MSDFALEDRGEGRFALSGEMSFDNAERILRASAGPFRHHTNVEVDFSGVNKADSAGLALLLEWKTWARQRGGQIRFSGLPEGLVAIARTTDVDHLL